MRLPADAWTVPVLLLAAAAPCAAQARIQHEPVACFLAESYPRLSAVVAPGKGVAQARVFFRAEPTVAMPAAGMGSPQAGLSDTPADGKPLDGGGERVLETAPTSWYSVAMSREGDTFSAVLPRPRASVGKVRYFIEVTDAAAASLRDKEHVVEVVGVASACGTRKVAEIVDSAKVVVQVPPDAPLIPPVPRGFSPVGATAVEGSLVVARKGGHKGLLLGVGAVALGGAVAIAQVGGPNAPPAGAPAPGFTVVSAFPPDGGRVSVSQPFIQVDLRIVPTEPLLAGTLNGRYYSTTAPSRTCGRMRQAVSDLDPSRSKVVRLHTLEELSACGPVDRLQVFLEDAQGRVTLATGASQPDFVVSLFFVN